MFLDPKASSILVSATAYSSDGPKLLRQVVRDIKERMKLVLLSSVYKVKGTAINPSHIHDLRSVTTFEGLSVVMELSTDSPPDEVLETLRKIELLRKSELLHRNISLNLLFFEEITYMTPELTLPHPDFHLRPELVIPAAEIWGEHRHPVLGISLAQLTRSFQNREWGEFFAQGQSLLDF